MICAKPPKENASGTTAGTAPGGSNPALIVLSTTVVSPNATRPNGAGFETLPVADIASLAVVSWAMEVPFLWCFGWNRPRDVENSRVSGRCIPHFAAPYQPLVLPLGQCSVARLTGLPVRNLQVII